MFVQEGFTALHLAAQADHVSVIEYLLSFQANIEAQDKVCLLRVTGISGQLSITFCREGSLHFLWPLSLEMAASSIYWQEKAAMCTLKQNGATEH